MTISEKHTIHITVNGKFYELEVESRRRLVEILRDNLGLTGTKTACEANVCGSCTVLLDGKSVHSCTILAVQADGKEIRTIEGASEEKQLHPVQQAYLNHLGYQCGFCTPGMIMASIALLEENPNPSSEEVRLGLTGNICRCTGYVKIVESVLAATENSRKKDDY
jgi:carbon-monoxide dehydrogenase small subunit